MKDPEGNEIGTYEYNTTGTYTSNQTEFQIDAMISQIGINGSSTYEADENWTKNSDGTYSAVTLTENERKVSVLTLRSDRIYIIQTSLNEKPWSSEVGVFTNDSLVYAGVIWVANHKDTEHSYLRYSGTTKRKQN
jgi:hypothetical protein